jgi:glycosyltransferase involved in cell wall biosynthesis
MRVVHVSKVTGIAGSEGHLIRLLPGLTTRGVDARMVVLEEPRRPVDGFCEVLEEHGVPVRRIPISRHLDPLLMGRLTRALRQVQPDLVHTHLLHADLYGLVAARRAGVPHAISSRHNDDSFRHHRVIKWANGAAMRRADRVITISHALERFVREVEEIDPDKVLTVHYGLEPPPSSPDARQQARQKLGYEGDDTLVGVFGRLVQQKGIDVLLEAFPIVRECHPDARLVVVGEGSLRADLEQQAARLGLDDAVTFTGWIENGRALMPACDLVVVPSRWEGFGLVTLEAMGYSLPIVASRTSALPEIVQHDKTGLLVPPEDPRALAGAINSLLSNPIRAQSLGKAGYRRLVTDFTVDKMVKATLEVYADVVADD